MKKTAFISAKSVAVCGILAAEALALSYLESLIPAVPFMPPGAKLGLSNIITMFSALFVGLPQALVIVLIKSGFVLLTRGAISAFISLSGGLLSALAMYFLKNNRRLGYIGISVISAICHNIGQLLAVSLVYGGSLFLSYAPVLILFGMLSGLITGVVINAALPALNKQFNIINTEKV